MDKQIEFLIRQYYQIQEHRLAFGNQVMQLRKSEQESGDHTAYFDRLHGIEKDIAKNLLSVFKKDKMYVWLKAVKGIGPVLGCALLTFIDITKAQHASSLWKYCGLAPGQRRKKGEKLDYSPFMKTICWKIGESFIKSKGRFRKVYDTSKAYYQVQHPEQVKEGKRTLYTKGHIHAMSRRRAVKLFLSEFWAEWRTLEGLPVSEPFAHRILPKQANPK